MPSSARLDRKGLDALYRQVGNGLLNLGLSIEADAKRRAPVLTGNLRRSIHTAAFVKGQRIYGATDENGKPIPAYAAESQNTATVIVGTNCGYGVYLELGTVKMVAQPYLGPALADNRGRAASLIKAGMDRYAGGVIPQ